MRVEVRERQATKAPAARRVAGRVPTTWAVLRLLGAFASFFARFATVDAVAALTRRRPLAVSVARRLERTLARLGPSYVRLAGLLRSHAAVRPSAALRGFGSSGDAAPRRAQPPPVPPQVVEDVVTRSLGPIGIIFATFDPSPMVVTAMAQLHAAVLADGREVLVKVRRPRRLGRSADDRLGSELCAQVMTRLLPRGVTVDRSRLARHLDEVLETELDLRVEAAEQECIAEELSMWTEDVVVPRPLPGMVTADVLVMTRLDGVAIADARDGQTAARLDHVVDALLWQATRTGVFHADLRAANLVALPDGRVGLLDFSHCGRLAEDQRCGLADLFEGIAGGEVHRQLRAFDQLGLLDAGVDRRALLADMAWADRLPGGSWAIDVLRELPRLCAVMADRGVQLPVPLFLFAADLVHLRAAALDLGVPLDVGRGIARRSSRASLPDAVPSDGPPLNAAELAAAFPRQTLETRPSLKDVLPVLGRVSRSMSPEGASPVITFAPFAIFLALSRSAGTVPAVLTATLSTLAISGYRKVRTGATDATMKVVTGLILVQGIFGLVFRSGKAFFAPLLIFPTLTGIVLCLSVMVGWPLFGVVADAIWPLPPAVRHDPAVARPYATLTVVVALFNFAIVAVNLWLMLTVSAEVFAGLSFVIMQVQGPMLLVPLWAACRIAARGAAIERRLLS
ncbi:MAG: hypothetical protein JWO37_3766 [Acidimicrobiales bacterium]|jgi:predicted unusual protein kinase regulating ubiquinone biosynthesis (AarF/ABC1/UbiB family)|nr:hypothetical protein [Acidimicrobiales bacterium]